MILSNRALFLPTRDEPAVTVREILGARKKWNDKQFLLQRNGWGGVKSVDFPGYTVTSGYMQAGAPYVGDFDDEHILDSVDRALLQGFKTPLLWPSRISETRRREMVAQCVIPGFARVLSEAAFKYQDVVHRGDAAMSAIDDVIEGSDAAAIVAAEEMTNTESYRAQVRRDVAQGDIKPVPASWVEDLGVHGEWVDYGERIGWAPRSMDPEHHQAVVREMPWLVCHNPPSMEESSGAFWKRRVREKVELHSMMAEQEGMAAEDRDVGGTMRQGERRKLRHRFTDRQFRNVHPAPDELARWDSNSALQESDPLWYGPYLEEGEKYNIARTDENVDRVCAEMGLDDLADEHVGERPYYRSLVYDHWILFDGLLRAIKGVEIDIDLSAVKPKRVAPFRWSPVKVAAGKKIIEGFVRDGIMGPVSSEWAWPALLVPKPKGGWRFVVDLRELNKLIPHDTYEPPSCDACLEWLAGKPYRSTFDLLHGFHGVLLSPETQKIFTVVTPFGTYCYKRLVMGYINATAEFQRHTNKTFGDLLWKSVLSMVDDVCVGSETLTGHRVDVRQAFGRMAARHHSVKPPKASILRKDVEYLGHISTPEGLRATPKHVEAIRDMPPPLDEDTGKINKTSLRSFIGLVKYVRRYIKDCGRLCDPLNQQLRDDADGKWSAVQDMVFNRLKHEIIYSKGVWHPNYKYPVYICTDGSKRGVGGYMFQKIDGEERVIGYFSRATRPDERKWDTRELEVLALIATLEHFHHYIDGIKVYLQTDHRNITWLGSMKKLSGRLGRWVLRLSEYNAEIAYRKGRYMFVADCLSRNSRLEPPGEESTTERAPRGLDVPDELFTGSECSRVEILLTEIPETGDGRNMFAVEFNVQSDAEVEHAIEAHMEADLSSFVQQSQVLESEGDGRHPSSGGVGKAMAATTRESEGAEVGKHPVDVPDEMMPEPVSIDEIRRAQSKDEFVSEMSRRIAAARSGDWKSKRFAVEDGVLYRRTSAVNPKEGIDTLRAYVPLELRSRVIHNHHSTIFAAHRNATATYKEMATLYYWNTMEKDVSEFVSRCQLCQLAKGTKPTRQGYLLGWNHNKVLHQVTMDLMGPFGHETSGHSKHPRPIYILVITDPFSHMLWLETIYAKSAEEVFEKFVYRFLLEEGCPRVVLTDNGREFDNKILRELMRLCRIRFKFTPAYHPRGNYTERVNRFVGESLRLLVNSPGGLKQDWFKMVKFVQLAYRRMYIPGTNISPNMVARGRQPCIPTELPLLDEGVAVTGGPALDEHVKEVEKNLKVAERLLTVAREETLRKSRERFNQNMIETSFEPGELVRYYNYVPIRRANDDGTEYTADLEIASKLKLKNRVYRVVSNKGTVYEMENVETGKPGRAHVSQLARMRTAETTPTGGVVVPVVPPPSSAADGKDALWDRMSIGKFAVIWLTGDDKSVLRVVEITHVNKELHEFGGWYNIHGRVARHYKAERPLVEWVCKHEYRKGGQTGFVSIPEKDKHKYERMMDTFVDGDARLIATGWNMESGGKVPKAVCVKVDTWLRSEAKTEPRALLALSYPSEGEKRKQKELGSS